MGDPQIDDSTMIVTNEKLVSPSNDRRLALLRDAPPKSKERKEGRKNEAASIKRRQHLQRPSVSKSQSLRFPRESSRPPTSPVRRMWHSTIDELPIPTKKILTPTKKMNPKRPRLLDQRHSKSMTTCNLLQEEASPKEGKQTVCPAYQRSPHRPQSFRLNRMTSVEDKVFHSPQERPKSLRSSVRSRNTQRVDMCGQRRIVEIIDDEDNHEKSNRNVSLDRTIIPNQCHKVATSPEQLLQRSKSVMLSRSPTKQLRRGSVTRFSLDQGSKRNLLLNKSKDAAAASKEEAGRQPSFRNHPKAATSKLLPKKSQSFRDIFLRRNVGSHSSSPFQANIESGRAA